jgi:hypothetical protein
VFDTGFGAPVQDVLYMVSPVLVAQARVRQTPLRDGWSFAVPVMQEFPQGGQDVGQAIVVAGSVVTAVVDDLSTRRCRRNLI